MKHLTAFIAGAYAPIAFVGEMVWRLISSAIALCLVLAVLAVLTTAVGQLLHAWNGEFDIKDHVLLCLTLATGFVLALSGAAWLAYDRFMERRDPASTNVPVSAR